MSDLDLKRYFYNKWIDADGYEEKFQILIDFVQSTDEVFAEHFFGLEYDDIYYFDEFDIQDFMEQNYEELDSLWKALIKYDKENEEDDE